jgi:hypothetical protein
MIVRLWMVNSLLTGAVEPGRHAPAGRPRRSQSKWRRYTACVVDSRSTHAGSSSEQNAWIAWITPPSVFLPSPLRIARNVLGACDIPTLIPMQSSSLRTSRHQN